jgi:acyl-CoA thioesterase
MDTAAQVAAAMFNADKASQHLGMKLEKIEAGAASLSMPVRDDMLNGLGICHGGITFALADTAFAFACNSRNVKSVALTCTVNYVAAAKAGDVLTAAAREVSLTGRTGIYDVKVTNQDGTLIAEFRGTSYATSSSVI